MKNKKQKLIIIACSIFCVTIGVFAYTLISSKASESNSQNALNAVQAALQDNSLAKMHYNNSGNPDEVVRVIVELSADCVADNNETSDYTDSLKNKEIKIIKAQSDIIKKVEKITGTEVISQSAYLTNSFSINTKKKYISDIANISDVDTVYEATTYEASISNAVSEGNVTAEWESKEYGYTGEGIVVAVLDTGVNYQHQDMILDDDTKTKFTEAEWQEKIELLGYGKYYTQKVPFGYDYTGNDDDILSKISTHGYHVSGIVSANGELTGVAPDAQIIALKVLDDYGYGTTDDIIRGIEDAVKLGADVINMSLGSDNALVSDEDYMQTAINNASESGVICCIAAGNASISSTLDGSYNVTNDFDMTDTSTIGSPSVAKSCLAVASANNISDDNQIISMSAFTSWGPTCDLTIKPEITAPGGNIYSLSSGVNSYEEMSGTSMATPFVSGCSSIVLNAIKQKGLDINGSELVNYVKTVLMNTSDAILDCSNYNINSTIPYSVRQQGIGMIDLLGAVSTDVIVTYNGEAKVELGELTKGTTFEVMLTNYGDTDAVYNLPSNSVYTNSEINNNYVIAPVDESYVSFNESSITVAAGKSVILTATLTLSANYNTNSFIESFILFEGQNVESLTLPLLAFYGDWDEEIVVDSSSYDTDNTSKIASLGYKTPASVLIDNSGLYLGLTLDSLFTGIDFESDSGIINTSNTLSNFSLHSSIKSISDKKSNARSLLKNTYILSIDDATELVAGTDYPVDITAGSSVYFKYTAPTSGYYALSSTGEFDTICSLYDADNNLLLVNDDYNDCNFIVEYYLNEGESYYYEVKLFDSKAKASFTISFFESDGSYFVPLDEPNLDISLEDCIELSVPYNDSVNFDDNSPFIYMSYIPEESGYYTLKSYVTDYTDTLCELYCYEEDSDSFNHIYINDDASYNNLNFELEYYLEKGNTYVYSISTFAFSDVELPIIYSKSDGFTYKKQNTTYIQRFNKDICAFSPNSDGNSDSISPALTMLRNAKKMTIKVLDSNKKPLQTIATLSDVRKQSLALVSWGLSLQVPSLINKSVLWDGTIYNKETGNYEACPDGQYYIEVSSKTTLLSDYQTITLPIKIDTVFPTVEAKLVKDSSNSTSLVFSATDNLSIYTIFETFYNDYTETNYFSSTSVDDDGNYVVPLGVLTSDYVGLYVKDTAGNPVYIELDNSDIEDSSESVSNTSVPSTTANSETNTPDSSEEITITDTPENTLPYTFHTLINDGDFVAITDSTFYFSGHVDDGISVSVNDISAVPQDDGEFVIQVPISESDSFTLNIKVTDSKNNILFDESYTLYSDTDIPTIEFDIAKDIYYDCCVTDDTFSQHIYLLNSDVEYPIPLKFKFNDSHLDISSINVTYNNFTLDTIEVITVDELEESDGWYTLSLTSDMMDDNFGWFTYTIQASDFAGRISDINLGLLTYDNYDVFQSISQLSDPSVYVVESNLPMLFSTNIITNDMLNEDGTFTFSGILSEAPVKFTVNNKDVSINTDTLGFTVDIDIPNGISKIPFYLEATNKVCYDTSLLFNKNDMSVSLNITNVDSNGVIQTKDELFTLSGTISSYIEGYTIYINGDNVYSSVEAISTHDGKLLNKDFTYNILLNKGENNIKLIVDDSTGVSITKNITVNYKPTKDVEKPKNIFKKLVKIFKDLFGKRSIVSI